MDYIDVPLEVSRETLNKMKTATKSKVTVEALEEIREIRKLYPQMGTYGTISVGKETLEVFLRLVGKALTD